MEVTLIDHEIVSMWFPVLVSKLRIVPFDLVLIVTSFRLILIANKIASSGGDVDRSQDRVHVVPCFGKQVENHAL